VQTVSLHAIAKEAFDAATIVPALLGIVSFFVSRYGGAYAMQHHPYLRYAPGLLLMAGGIAYGSQREGSHVNGVCILSGAAADLALAAAENSGVIPRGIA